MRAALMVVGAGLALSCSGKGSAKGPGAGPVREEVRAQGKRLQDLQNALWTAKERGPGGKGYKLGDDDLTQALAAVDLQASGGAKLAVFACSVDPTEAAMFIEYQGRLQTLADRLAEHVRQSKIDGKRPPPSAGAPQYGIVLRAGPDGPAFAYLVEVGAPVCANMKPNPDGCGGERPKGFLFRNDPASPWGTKEWSDTPQIDKLMPLGDTGVLRGLMAGSQTHFADIGYMQRIQEIDQRTEDLMRMKKEIENRLAAAAAK